MTPAAVLVSPGVLPAGTRRHEEGEEQGEQEGCHGGLPGSYLEQVLVAPGVP